MMYLIEQLSWLLGLAFVAGLVIGWIASGRAAAIEGQGGESA